MRVRKLTYGEKDFKNVFDFLLQNFVPEHEMGVIGEQQDIAVSPDEYIVAADVVSGLGDGSSQAGADILDEIAANVRSARSGGRQPAPINLSRIMPT